MFKNMLTLTSLGFLDINFDWVWYYIKSFKKYQNSYQGHVTFLMMLSYLKTVIEVKYFYN